jgi:chemotaxis receptor (MCP) glutamine deamidase CheD
VAEGVTREIIVPVDQFELARDDIVLIAMLKSTFALCFYDAVQEGGALLHMQVGRPGRANDPELTDNTLSTDLLLLDHCLADLRGSEPKARNWQAKLVAHVGEAKGDRERMLGMEAFLTAFLDDAEIKLISVSTHENQPQRLRFRPAMGQLRSESVS